MSFLLTVCFSHEIRTTRAYMNCLRVACHLRMRSCVKLRLLEGWIKDDKRCCGDMDKHFGSRVFKWLLDDSPETVLMQEA